MVTSPINNEIWYDPKEQCDIILTSRNADDIINLFHCHSIILAVASPFFDSIQKTEFKSQLRQFDSQLQLLTFQLQNPSQITAAENAQLNNSLSPQFVKELSVLISFISHCSPCYPETCKNVPNQLLQILKEHSDALPHLLRRTTLQALILLQNRSMINRLVLLPTLFDLFATPDKQLRKTLFSHIVHDIKRVNQNKQNIKLNNHLQNYLFNMLSQRKDLSSSQLIAAKKALDIMIDLYRRKIWADDKTVNVIASTCFHSSVKLRVKALKFFLGVEFYDEIEYDSDEEDEMEGNNTQNNSRSKSMSMRSIREKTEMMKGIIKRRKKRERALGREKRKVNSVKRKSDGSDYKELNALNLIYEPQSFAERLFSQLKQSNDAFVVRLLLMNVISRLIGTHQLLILNFYPFLQRYMQPHNHRVTLILTYLAQASHELVPPEILQTCIRLIADAFVSDRSSVEVVCVGINAIREVCRRQPLCMTKELLLEMSQFKKHKNKGILMASRSIIALYRALLPSLLHRRERGKEASIAVSNGTAEELK